MKCAARTKKGTLCERDHTSGCTVRGADGWVYFLCRQHYTMAETNNVVLDMVQMPSRGHKADQPQLDLGPIAQAYVTKEVNNVTNTIHIKCRKCAVEADVTKDSESYKRFKANGGLCKNCAAKTKAEAHSSNPDERIVKVTCGKGENRHKWETTLTEFRQHKGICPEHRS